MNDTEARARQYEAALDYLTKKREDITLDWESIKRRDRLFFSLRNYFAPKLSKPTEKPVEESAFRLYLKNAAS